LRVACGERDWRERRGRRRAGGFRATLHRVFRPRLELLESRLAPAAHDTLGTAYSLSFDSHEQALVAGFLADDNQVDLYKAQLHAGDRITAAVQAYSVSNPLDSGLRAFDQNGNQIAFNDDGNGNRDPLLTFIAPADGTYYIGVSSFADYGYDPNVAGSGVGGNSAGSYTLSVSRDATFDTHDTFNTAIELSSFGNSGGQTSGNLLGPNQVDLYHVRLSAGDLVTATVTANSASNHLDSALRLFDSTGKQLAFNDNARGPDPALTFTALAAGDYYIGVSSASNFSYDPHTTDTGADGGSTGQYALNVTDVPTHGTLGTADFLFFFFSNSTQASGHLADPNEVHLYQMLLSPGDKVTASVTAYSASNPLDSVLRVFDSDGKQLAINDNANGPDPSVTFTVANFGSYFIGVSSAGNITYDPQTAGSGSGGNSTGDFTLKATRVPTYATISAAKYLSFNGIQAQETGTLADPNQVDIYQVSLNTGQKLTASVTASGASNPLDSSLRVFDSKGNPLAFNDNARGLDPALTFTAPDDDTYYVGVSAANNFGYDPNTPYSGSGGQSTGSYTLNVSRITPHDTLSTSQFLFINGAPPVPESGTLADPNQVDLYNFVLATGDKVTASVTAYSPSNPLDSGLRVFDSKGNRSPSTTTQTASTPQCRSRPPAMAPTMSGFRPQVTSPSTPAPPTAAPAAARRETIRSTSPTCPRMKPSPTRCPYRWTATRRARSPAPSAIPTRWLSIRFISARATRSRPA
jgi:hypothetical protein